MSATYNNTVEFIATAEADKVFEATTIPAASSSITSVAHIDAVQLIALVGSPAKQFVGTGIARAIEAGGYKQGVVYDYLTATQIKYATKMESVLAELKADPTRVVSNADVFKGNYDSVRTSLKIVSDLITPATGDAYFMVEKQDFYINNGATGSVKNESVVFGLGLELELYVDDLSKGMFHFLENGKPVQVWLLDSRLYDFALRHLKENKENQTLLEYHKVLKAMDREVRREFHLEGKIASKRNAAQQKLFYTCMKSMQDKILSIIPAASKAATK